MEDVKEQLKSYGFSTPFFGMEGQTLYGRVVSVYDGDTMTLVLPVFNHYYRFNVRLLGIDTSEMKSKSLENKERAHQARNAVLSSLGIPTNITSRKDIQKYLHENVIIVTIHCGEFDKYGRLLGNVFVENCSESLSDMLIRLGYAYRYYGDTKMTEHQQEKLL